MSKFTITKGVSNEFIITIKQNGTTLPMTIEPTDVFTSKLLSIKDGSVVATLITEVLNASNGKLRIIVDDSVVDSLLVERGDRADYYYSKPLYKLVIDCDTVNNGKFVAKVHKVYVE